MIASPSDKNDKTETLTGAFEVAHPRPATSMAVASAVEPEEAGGKGSRLYRCIVSGQIKPREELVRFVISPDGVVTPDLEGKLPGRGYWVTCRYNEIHRAVAENMFSRAVNANVTIPAAMIANLIMLLRRAAQATLGLARRDWNVEFGQENVRVAINARKVGVVLIASNAPSEFADRLDGVRGDLPVIRLFTTAELSQALGRESLIFASVNKGQWTQRLMIECKRLADMLAP